MSSRALIAAFAAAAALALPASAPADSIVKTNYKPIIAAGEGTTTCIVSDQVYDRPFSDHFEWHAETDCDRPVEQLGEAWWWNDDPGPELPWNQYDGPCTGLRTNCLLEGGDQGEFHGGQIRHHVKLRAPLGQGWVHAPSVCSGIGTDNLECWFE